MRNPLLVATVAISIATGVFAAPASAGCAEDIEKTWKDKEVFIDGSKTVAIQKVENILNAAKRVLAAGKVGKCERLVAKAKKIIAKTY